MSKTGSEVLKGGRAAKAKGAHYERELAEWFNDHLFDGEERVKRTLLSGGGTHTGDADLQGTPLLFVEAKRTETVRVHDAMRQAEKNRNAIGATRFPVVITRRNRMAMGESLVVMKLEDFTKLYQMAIDSYLSSSA